MIENPEKLDPEETDENGEWKDIKKILEKENPEKWFKEKGIDIRKIKEETNNEKEELEKIRREAEKAFEREKE